MTEFKKTLLSKSGHLIDKTIGSTNEISFSVLDKAKQDVNLGGETSEPWRIDENKVAEAKKKRTSKIRKRILALTLLVVVGIIAILLAISTFVQINTGSLGNLKHDLNKTIELSDETNEVLGVGNTLLTSDCSGIANSDFLKNFDNVEKKAKDSKNKTEDLKNRLSDEVKEIATPSEVEAANNAIDALDKQVRLIDSMLSNITEAKPYIEEWVYTSNAMTFLVQGDSDGRDATNLLGNANIDDARRSIEKSKDAIVEFTHAKESFESAKDVNAINADFGDYITYCEKRIDAENSGIASAQAYIDRNKELLASQNQNYNDLQSAAQEIASKWGDKPFDQVNNEFKSRFQGRSDVWYSDMALREKAYKAVKLYLEKNS